MEELISLGRLLWDNAEPGFFEINTHKILSKKFKELGFVIQKFENIPGFIATIDGSYETKPIVLISDMDALPLPAIGGKVEISVQQGYAPFKADLTLHKLIKETADDLNVEFIEEQYSSASSDVGDISQMKPTVMLGLPGVNGKFHNPDFRVTDEEGAFVFPSEFLVEYIRRVALLS